MALGTQAGKCIALLGIEGDDAVEIAERAEV